ncbi:unnamed protein product, partial [Prorocentrum cordatum]
MPPTEYTRQFFTDWTDASGVREIQHQYDKIRSEADASSRSVQEELKAKGYASHAAFCAACPRFGLWCWPTQFGELGSGVVLYFHLLALMMTMFVFFSALQIYPMVVYARGDYLAGWQFTWWVDLYNSNSAEVCQCVGYNNGLTGPDGDPDYGTYCSTWDMAVDHSSFANPGRWTCGAWCFASKSCPAPLLAGADTPLSNRVQAPNDSPRPWDSGYRGLVRAYGTCVQDTAVLDACTATGSGAYGESGGGTIGTVDEGEAFYATDAGWLSVGNHGQDALGGQEARAICSIYFVCLVVLCGSVFVAYQLMVVTDTRLDADLVLPDDFAVMFQGLPVTATDEKSLKEWFSNNAVRDKTVEIVKVVIGWDFGTFASLIKEMKLLKRRLDELDSSGTTGLKSYFSCLLSAPETSVDEASVEEEKASIKAKMAEISKSLNTASSSAEMTSSGVVVVVFRFQEDMRLCLRRWNSFYQRWFYRDGLDAWMLPKGNSFWPGGKLPKFPVGDIPIFKLFAVRAPVPGNIHWEELGVPASIRYKMMAKTNAVMAVIILVCLGVTWSLNVFQDWLRESGDTGVGFTLLGFLPAIGLALSNVAIVAAAKKTGDAEFHDTWTSENFSQMTKMATGLFLNTAGVMFVVNAQPREWYQAGGLVYDVTIFLIFTSMIPAFIPLVDIGWLLKLRRRKQLTDAKLEEWNEVIRRGPPKSEQMKQDYQKVVKEVEIMKLAFTPSELNTTRRFANALKTFMACVLYMPVSPYVSLVGFFGILAQYWVDKYVLLTWAKRPRRQLSRELPLYSLKVIKYTIPLSFSISTWMFLTPSLKDKSYGFDNLWLMLAVTVIYTLFLPFSVWTKPFLRWFDTHREEGIDYYQAQFMWTKEMKYHKDQFIYKKLPESVNPEMLSPDTETVKMDAVKASYGAALGAAGAAAAGTVEEAKPLMLKGGMTVGEDEARSSYAAAGEERPRSRRARPHPRSPRSPRPSWSGGPRRRRSRLRPRPRRRAGRRARARARARRARRARARARWCGSSCTATTSRRSRRTPKSSSRRD